MITSGETLRLIRQLKGIKQETVAKELGISQPAYCQIEKCNYVDNEKFEKVVSILGYSKTELKNLFNHLPFQNKLNS